MLFMAGVHVPCTDMLCELGRSCSKEAWYRRTDSSDAYATPFRRSLTCVCTVHSADSLYPVV